MRPVAPVLDEGAARGEARPCGAPRGIQNPPQLSGDAGRQGGMGDDEEHERHARGELPTLPTLPAAEPLEYVPPAKNMH